MRMRRTRTSFHIVLGCTAFAVSIAAGDITVSRGTFSSGAGTTTGTTVSVSYTIGEPVVGNTAGVGILVNAGFWAADGGVACAPDLNMDGVLDFFDVTAFLNAFSAGEAVGDFNGDGVWDFFDVSSFLAAFSAGCP